LAKDANTADYDSYVLPTDARPAVILVVGVNGVGKTTTIGKLAHQFRQQGHKVLLGAADTFRAAAVDQLGIWAERTGAGFFSKGMNVDPAAVAYEATDKAVKEGYDDATNVTAIALTKLDGTAKGGVVIGISDQFQTPIKYIGVGEGVEQLQIFNKEAFVESLFGGQLIGK